MFLKYNWLVKHNPEVYWDKETIQFTKYPKRCKIQYQNTLFKSRTRKITPTKEIDKKNTRKLKKI